MAKFADVAKLNYQVHKVVPKVAHQRTIDAILSHETQTLKARKDEEDDGGDFEGPKLLKGYTRSRLFTNVVNGFIVCNVIAIAIDTDYGDETGGIAIFEHVTCIVFLAEMIMKALDEGGRGYFKRKWNIFDFILSWCTILDIWVGLSSSGVFGLSSLRILRIVRVVKVLRHNEHLRLCLAGISAGMDTIAVVACLIGFLAFVSAIFMTQTVGKQFHTFGYNHEPEALEASANEWNNYQDFGTVPRSMLTMFNLGLGIGWSKYASIFAEKQMPWMLVLIFGYLAFVSWGLMSAIIAVVVSGVLKAVKNQHKEDKREELARKNELLQDLIKHWSELDSNGSTCIDHVEMERIFQMPAMREILGPIGLAQSAGDLVRILDRGECNGVLSQDEFLRGMYRWIENPGDWKFCVMKVWSHNMTQIMKEGHKNTQENQKTMQKNQSETHAKLDLIMGEIQNLKSQVALLHQGPVQLDTTDRRPPETSVEKPQKQVNLVDQPRITEDPQTQVKQVKNAEKPQDEVQIDIVEKPQTQVNHVDKAQQLELEDKIQTLINNQHEQLGVILKALEVHQSQHAAHAAVTAEMDRHLGALHGDVLQRIDHAVEAAVVRLQTRQVEQIRTSILTGFRGPSNPDDVGEAMDFSSLSPHAGFDSNDGRFAPDQFNDHGSRSGFSRMFPKSVRLPRGVNGSSLPVYSDVQLPSGFNGVK